MTSHLKWASPQGTDTLKNIVQKRLPQWPNGLRDYQSKFIPRVLDGEKVFVITATGDGKSTFYDIPPMVHMEIRDNPHLYPPFQVKKKPVVVVVTPTKGLADSIIHDAREFGLNGISYCHETVSDYHVKEIDLVSLISRCEQFQIICVDPERLSTKEWRLILRNPTFQENLVVFCCEESQLIRTWGLEFRPAFQHIGVTAQGFVPKGVSIVGLSATSAPGRDTLAVCHSLGMFGDDYHLVRRSNERTNMQLIIDTLQQKKRTSKYAQLLNYLRSGRKTIIHVNTIPEAYDIYEFLWDHVPPTASPLHRMRMYHSLCDDKYNRETFYLMDNSTELQVVIATPGFSCGINLKKVKDSITIGFPSTLDMFYQCKGRAGRSQDVICRGIAIVPKKTISLARKYVKGAAKKSKSKKKLEELEELTNMDFGKASFLAENECRMGNINDYYGNPPVEITRLNCKDANRSVYCDLCATRHRVHYSFNPSEDDAARTWLPLITGPSHRVTHHHETTLEKEERESMRSWMVDFRQTIWAEFEPLDPVLSHFPIAHFFPDLLIDEILNKFLTIDSYHNLELLLHRHHWPYVEQKGQYVFKLIVGFQDIVHERREEKEARGKENKPRKKRGRNASKQADQCYRSDVDEPDTITDDGNNSEAGNPQAMGIIQTLATSTSSKSETQTASTRVNQARKPRQPLQSVQEVTAEYGPQRKNYRRN
ncbi:P-loop containing nucleoside triphosphate hydrolase protein [Dendrothele bispora CBS 962.96]|uniref:DNA 3'-5' helicase n=1 Tax=Dendrothele bispora (strain CBS 962.96) TaxID=1314807 RepID=A0A4S8LL67_DENBC|nr:P-loop containing nucleoside triphosphate hydrolase protein [Dendrothele bispora CBS 962.96]